MGSILLYGWPVRVVDERMLEVFDNGNIHHILHMRRRDCVPSVELPYKYAGTARTKKTVN